MSRFFGATAKPYGGRHQGGGGGFGGGGGGFTPLSIAGLKVWIDASQIVGKNDGDAISQWDDGSGNAFHFTQATGTKQPTYQTNELNGKAVVRFDGSDDMMQSSFDNTNVALSVLIVGRSIDPQGGATRRMFGFGDNASVFFNGASGANFAYFNAGGVRDLGVPASTTAGIVGLIYNSAASLDLYLNGTQKFSALAHDNDYYGGLAQDGIPAIGAQGVAPNEDAWAKCDIAELLIYDGALSSTNRDLLETYLGAKYGITVA